MIITNEFISKYRGKQPNWGFGDLSYITYKRSYARDIKDENRTEEFYETLQRAINGAQELGADYTKEEAERLFEYMWNFKCSFAGRMLKQLGTDTVRKFGMNSLLNCWYVSIDSIDSFLFLFENLMLGGGVGFSVKREHIYELPRIKRNVNISLKNEKDADFIVPDSREGWVKLLKNVLTSYFITGESFNYSTILIRGYGEPIQTFGGTASGPKILVDGIQDICRVFKEREGKKIRSIDVLDICNIIGKIVVSGNVRRSAEIAIGDADDVLFINAKRWDNGLIPNWRAMSNNTIEIDDVEKLDEIPSFWHAFEGKGEPLGLFNLRLSRLVGRLGEKKRDNCEGLNPCTEATLYDKECCNLSEVFLNAIKNIKEFIDCCKLLYKTQKTVCNGKYLHKATENIVHKNNRIIIGITGICQSSEEQLGWLDSCYKEIKEFDKEYSKLKGWNESIKLTGIKPSGTLSLLSGSTPGIHPGFSEYYYRTVRVATANPLVQYCKDRGYKIEYERDYEGNVNYDTMVIYFPINLKNAIYVKDMSAIQQLELVKKLQTTWVDNAISVTVYYKKEEIAEIKQWLLDNYKDSIKTVSFSLHSEHGYDQAVYQEITKEEYEESVGKLKDVKYIDEIILDKNIQECDDGSCGVNDIIFK